MKVDGVIIDQPNQEEIFIPRGDKVIRFIAQGVLDDSDRDKLLPRPIPPRAMKPGGVMVENVEDPSFKKQLQLWGERRTSWLIITSLRATPGLEWDTVKYDQPSTWPEWENELKKVFTPAEIQRIMNGVLAANGLNEERMEKARQSFLLVQAIRLSEQVSQKEEQPNMPSGVLANDSVSILPESSTPSGTK